MSTTTLTKTTKGLRPTHHNHSQIRMGRLCFLAQSLCLLLLLFVFRTQADFEFHSCNTWSEDRVYARDWNSKTVEKRVVAFHHVFKTAGSTIRQLLRELTGPRCHFGYASVVDNNFFKELTDRNGNQLIKKETPFKEGWMQVKANADIIGGHQRFDTINKIWPELEQHQVGRIVFVREPLSRFISAVIFIDSKTPKPCRSEADVIIKIQEKVDAFIGKQAFPNGYWKYLSNETQNDKISGLEQVEIMKQHLNMVHVVGVVEKWSASIDLMASLLDTKGKMTKHFTATKRPSSARNTGVISTSGVRSMLEKEHPALLQQVLHMLRFEDMVYQHGLKIHLKQVANLNI
jgi:hypothetical protein